MTKWRTIRKAIARSGMGALFCGVLLTAAAPAQVSSYGDKDEGTNTGDQLPTVLQKVEVEQHLNQQLPLDAQFVDDTGRTVRLGDYFASIRDSFAGLLQLPDAVLGGDGRPGRRAGDGAHEPGQGIRSHHHQHRPSETPSWRRRRRRFT